MSPQNTIFCEGHLVACHQSADVVSMHMGNANLLCLHARILDELADTGYVFSHRNGQRLR